MTLTYLFFGQTLICQGQIHMKKTPTGQILVGGQDPALQGPDQGLLKIRVQVAEHGQQQVRTDFICNI